MTQMSDLVATRLECSVTISSLLHAIRSGRAELPPPGSAAGAERDASLSAAAESDPPEATCTIGAQREPDQEAAAQGATVPRAALSTPDGLAARSGLAGSGPPCTRRGDRKAGFMRLKLRRDGAPPLIFDGALLLRIAVRTQLPSEGESAGHGGEAPCAAAIQTLELFVTSAGRIVAAIRAEPQGDAPIRPVFRAGDIAAAAEFEAFLAEFDAGAIAGASRSRALALRSDFARLISGSGLRAFAPIVAPSA